MKINTFLKKIKPAMKEYMKNSLYTFSYKHYPLKSKTVFIESRTGEDLAGNMFRIAQELERKKYKVYIAAKRSHMAKVKSLVQIADLKNATIVPMYSNKYYRLLATAKYLFNDTMFDWKYIKKDGQIYVNTWHGTPLKKLGYDVAGEQYIMGNGQRNLLMCDYIAVPNEFCAEKLLSAYCLNNIFHGKVLLSGYPRNDVFFDKKIQEKVRTELNIKEKKVYVYMPTWRGLHTNKDDSFTKTIKETLSYLDQKMSENQVMYVKLHNLMRAEVELTQYKHIKPFPTQYETYEMLSCADCLITDYSSVFFDFANAKKKIILYVPDKKEYESERGMYFSIDELPFSQTDTPHKLWKAMQENNTETYIDFIEQYCSYDKVDSTSKLLEYIIFGNGEIKEYRVPNNGKKNIAIYCGNVEMKNGLTTAAANLLNNIELSKYNFYFVFFRKLTTSVCDFWYRIPREIEYYSISSSFFFTYKEKVAHYLQTKWGMNSKIIDSILDEMCKREVRKLFYDAPFDYFVHFEGYGTNDTIPLIQQYPKRKIIFVHNDMVREIATRKNQNEYVLKRAYLNYDKVAVVSPDLIEPTKIIGAPKEKIYVVDNVHDVKDIVNRSTLPIEFEKDTICITRNIDGINGVLCSTGKKFITIGRFSPEKGHKRLLSAFDFFCERYPETQLIIIGGHGVLYNNTLNLVQKMKFGKNVTIIKSLKNPMPILKKCDLFILPSLYEGLGLVLLEADCLGIPTFSTDITGPKMFMEKHHGYLVTDSEKGILEGMYDYMDGKIHTLDINYQNYNQKALDEFYTLFENEGIG